MFVSFNKNCINKKDFESVINKIPVTLKIYSKRKLKIKKHTKYLLK